MSQGRAEFSDIAPPPPPPPRSDSSAAPKSRSDSRRRAESDDDHKRRSSRSPRHRRDDRSRSRSSRSSRSYSDSYSRSRSSSYSSYTSRSYSGDRSRDRSSSYRRERSSRRSPPRRRSVSGGRREVVDPSRMPMVPVPGTYGGYSHMPPPPPPPPPQQQHLQQANYYAPPPPPPPQEPEEPVDIHLESVLKLATKEHSQMLERNATRHRLGLVDLYPIMAVSDKSAINTSILHRVCVEFSVPLIFQNSTTKNAAPASGQLGKKDLLRGKTRGAAALHNNAELKVSITEAMRFVRYHIAGGYSEELAKGLVWRVVESQGQQDRLGAWMLLDEAIHVISEVADVTDPFALDGRPSDSNARRSGLVDGEMDDQAHQSALLKNADAQRTAAKFIHRMKEYLPYLILFCWDGGPNSKASQDHRVQSHSPAVLKMIKASNTGVTDNTFSELAAIELARIRQEAKEFLYGLAKGDGTLTDAGDRVKRQQGAAGMSGSSGYTTLGTHNPLTAASQGGEINLSSAVRNNISKQIASAYDGIMDGWELHFKGFFKTHLFKAICDNVIVACSGVSASNIITADHRKKFQKYFRPPTNAFLDSIWKLRRKEPRPSLAEFILVTYGWPCHRLATSSDAIQQFHLEEQFGSLMPASPFVTHLPCKVEDLKKAGCAPLNSKALSWVQKLIEKRGGCTMCDTWDHTSVQCPNRAEVVFLRNGERLPCRMNVAKAHAELEKHGFVLETIESCPAVQHLIPSEERQLSRSSSRKSDVALAAPIAASPAPVMEKRLRLLTAAVLDMASELIVLNVDHTPLLDALDIILGQRSTDADRQAITTVATYHLSPSRILHIMPKPTSIHRATTLEFCTEAGISTLNVLRRSHRFRECDKLEKAIETLFYRYCSSKYAPTHGRPTADVATVFSDVYMIQKLRTFLFSWWEQPLEECIAKNMDKDEGPTPAGISGDIAVMSAVAPTLSVAHNQLFEQLSALYYSRDEPHALVLLGALSRLRKVAGLICRVTLKVTPLGSHIPVHSPFPTLIDRHRNVVGEIAVYVGGSTAATNVALMKWDWFIAKDVVLLAFNVRDMDDDERGGSRKKPREMLEDFIKKIENEAFDAKDNDNALGFYKLNIVRALIDARDYCFFCHKIGHAKGRCPHLLSIIVDRTKKEWNINTITEARLSYNRLALRMSQIRNEIVPYLTQKKTTLTDSADQINTVEVIDIQKKLDAALEAKAQLEQMRDAATDAGTEISDELRSNLARAASIVEQHEMVKSKYIDNSSKMKSEANKIEDDIKLLRRESNQMDDVLCAISSTGFRFMPSGARVDVYAGIPNQYRSLPLAYKSAIDALGAAGISVKRARYCPSQCISILRSIEANDLVRQVQPITEVSFPDVDLATGKFLDDILHAKEDLVRKDRRVNDRPGILGHTTLELGERDVDAHFNPSNPTATCARLMDLQIGSQDRMSEFAIYIKTIYRGMENVYSLLTPITAHSRAVSTDLAIRGAALRKACIARLDHSRDDRATVLNRLRTEAYFFRTLSTSEEKMAYIFASLRHVKAELCKATDDAIRSWSSMAVRGPISSMFPGEPIYTFGPAETTPLHQASCQARGLDQQQRTGSIAQRRIAPSQSVFRAHQSVDAPRSHSRFRASSLDLFTRRSSNTTTTTTTTTTTASPLGRAAGTQLMYTQDDSSFTGGGLESALAFNNGNGYNHDSPTHDGLLDPLLTLGEKRPRQDDAVQDATQEEQVY